MKKRSKSLIQNIQGVDHLQTFNDIIEFFMNGDQAPERRANYHYCEK